MLDIHRIFIIAIAFRLIQFIAVDKKRTNLPEGESNGLPISVGAMIVLGTSLITTPEMLWVLASISVGFMVSHIRFIRFERVLLKQISKPVFFLICASIIITLSYIFVTKNIQIFGYIILCYVLFYMVLGRLKRNQQRVPG